MKVKTSISRWTAVASLAVACAGALAGPPEASNLVWVENESFGFEACADAAATADKAASTLAALRSRAAGDIEAALRARGVVLGADRFVALTPVSGALACRGVEGQVTFRVSAVDRRARTALTVDMQLRTAPDAADRSARLRLSNDLARHFGDAPTRSAML